MNKEEEFKRKLRELLDGKSFAFEENDWHSAKELLDKKRRKRRPIPFMLFFGALSIGALGLLFWPNAERQDTQMETKALVLQKGQEQAADNRISEPQPVVKHQVQAPAGSTQKNTVSAANIDRNSDGAVALPVASGNKKSKPEAPMVYAPQVNEMSKAADPPLVSALLPSILQTPADEKNPQSQSVVEKETDVVVPAQAQSKAESGIATDSMAVQAGTSAAENTLASVDSAAAPAAKGAVPSPELRKKMLISAEAGFNLLSGWNSSAGTEGRGINPVLGLNYHGQLNDKIECSAGFHFTTILGLHAYSDTSKITRYGFGEESEVTVISPKTLLYLNFPLRVLWNFNLKQAAGLNLEPGYLINSISRVEQYVQSVEKGDSQYSQELGYTQGFSEFNLQFGLFYRQRIMERFYLQPELFIGLRDLKDNGFFHSNTAERSSGLKLTLLYTLLRR